MEQRLPTELLELIVCHLAPRELRIFRLLDRRCSKIGTPYLFERIHGSLFSRSLERLTALSQSEDIAKHVKAIDFHPDELPAYSREQWEEAIDSQSGHDFTPDQLDAGWLAYQRLCAEQQGWSENGEGMQLQRILAKFHNLTEVVAACARPKTGGINDTPYWKSFMQDTLVGPDAWTSDWIGPGTLETRCKAQATFMLLESVANRHEHAGMKPIERLGLEMPRYYAYGQLLFLRTDCADPEDEWNMGTVRDERYKAIRAACAHLKHLTLWSPFIDDYEDSYCRQQDWDTSQIVGAAKELQSLTWEVGEPITSEQDMSRDERYLDMALERFLWSARPHLQEVKISAAMEPDVIVNFLLRNKDTLKSLELRNCIGYHWYSVLEIIAQNLEKLEHVYIESLWTSPRIERRGRDEKVRLEEPALLLGEGLDDGSDYAKSMRAFLLTGAGRLPMEDGAEYHSDDYESDSEVQRVVEEVIHGVKWTPGYGSS